IFRYPLGPRAADGRHPRRTDLGPLWSTVELAKPIDMVLVSGDPKRLVVLVQGQLGRSESVETGLYVLDLLKDGSTRRPRWFPLATAGVVTPTALVYEAANTFVIADARDELKTEPDKNIPVATPGVLVRVRIDDLGSDQPKLLEHETWDSYP